MYVWMDGDGEMGVSVMRVRELILFVVNRILINVRLKSVDLHSTTQCDSNRSY
jgi:hypothetical protein